MKKNVVIFDDSDYSLDEYDEVFMGADVEILKIQRPFLHEVIGVFGKFKPDLIIVDIAFEGDNEAGYSLINEIKKNSTLKDIPLIVCSKLTSDSDAGKTVSKKCEELGAAKAYSKLPKMPLASKLLKECGNRD